MVDIENDLENESSSDDEVSLFAQVKPWLTASVQIIGWIYSATAIYIMCSLFGSILFAADRGSCTYGVALLYKPCLLESFAVLEDANSFDARVKSCSDPGPGRMCLGDFELNSVSQQCTIDQWVNLPDESTLTRWPGRICLTSAGKATVAAN